MPRPTHRSRSWRRIYLRTPGGRTTVHYERRKVNPPRCAICKQPLNMPRMDRKAAREGFRTPGRPYAGCVCPKCLRDAIKRAVRIISGVLA
ncbi:MAG: 50S ribosomal protein L34e [Thermoprotei archaeon]|nr:MAG: 50S ribosomal protein L34e [Thermoprotei archaeon]RLF24293.1 MAG: 50S ribosomal protein L34e [Thermoprotei archaeon]